MLDHFREQGLGTRMVFRDVTNSTLCGWSWPFKVHVQNTCLPLHFHAFLLEEADNPVHYLGLEASKKNTQVARSIASCVLVNTKYGISALAIGPKAHNTVSVYNCSIRALQLLSQEPTLAHKHPGVHGTNLFCSWCSLANSADSLSLSIEGLVPQFRLSAKHNKVQVRLLPPLSINIYLQPRSHFSSSLNSWIIAFAIRNHKGNWSEQPGTTY